MISGPQSPHKNPDSSDTLRSLGAGEADAKESLGLTGQPG